MDEKTGRTRQLTVGKRKLRRLRVGAYAFVCLALPTVAIGVFGSTQTVRISLLQSRNAELQGELLAFEDQVGAVGEKIDEITQRDARLRALAGLDPLDAEVLMAGVGGPGSPTLDSYGLNDEDAAIQSRAFDVSISLDEYARRADLLLSSLNAAVEVVGEKRDLLESTPSIKPVDGWLTSSFSEQRLHPIHNLPLPHYGVDISAPRGTQVMATAKGRVVRATNLTGYGLTVEIDHGHGFLTRYAHADRLLVRAGQTVARGDPIALVGDTGTSTSTHVHYEVHLYGVPQNPRRYFFPEEIRD